MFMLYTTRKQLQTQTHHSIGILSRITFAYSRVAGAGVLGWSRSRIFCPAPSLTLL